MRQVIDEDNFVKLGMAVLTTKKTGWELLNHYALSQSLFNQSHHKSCSFDSLCHSKQKIAQECQISIKSDYQHDWKNQYMLHVPEPTSEYLYADQLDNQYKPQPKYSKTTILISSQSTTMTNLINLLQRGDVKMCRPRPLKAPSERQSSTNAFGFNQVYYINNFNDAFCFKFATQFWVRQKLLIKMTQNYQKYEANMYKIRDEDNRRMMDRLNQQCEISSQRNIEQQFINVLNLVFKESTLDIQKDNGDQLKDIDLPINSHHQIQQCSSTSVNPFISKNSKFNTQSTVIPFDFGGDTEAGLFFNLDPQLVVESPTPSDFMGELKNYQSQALTWLLFREGQSKHPCMDMTDIPFWQETSSRLELKQKLLINKNLNFVVWKRNVEKHCNGGILADQMGLGKTVMIIALILANRPKENCQTLIIAPLSVVRQWKNQLKLFAPSLKVLVLNQQTINKTNLKLADIVITSQGKLRAESISGKQGGLLDNQWYRVVIDEAHNFKNSATAMAKSICQLNAQYRWCLTGTPTQNCIADLFSLIKFLQLAPWCEASWWEASFPRDVRKTTSQHFIKVKALLKGILLRRKKQSVDINGLSLLSLPKADVKVHVVQLSQQAKIYYKRLDWKAKNALKNLENLQKKIKKCKLQKGQRKLINLMKKSQYNEVLVLMLKLRMLSCHQFLLTYQSNYLTKENFITDYLKFIPKTKIKRKPKVNFFDCLLANPEEKQNYNKEFSFMNKVYENWDERIHEICMNSQKMECLLCSVQDDCVITPCLHIFCNNCISSFIHKKWLALNFKQTELDPKQIQKLLKLNDFVSECPHCGDSLKKCELFDLPRLNEFNRPFDQFVPNDKLNSLAMYLKKMKSSDKALVFTYFLGMMKLVGRMLQQMNITYLTLQGSDSYETRDSKITQFNANPRITVLILTLKIGSVGLNLEAANKVFFMDPWWNPAIQEQAIARVHRIGQVKQVEAVKFITESTIESRILKLSLIKKQMSDSILDIDDVKNNTKYSKKRSEMRFLLAVQEQFDQSNDQQQEQLESDKIETDGNQQVQLKLNDDEWLTKIDTLLLMQGETIKKNNFQ